MATATTSRSSDRRTSSPSAHSAPPTSRRWRRAGVGGRGGSHRPRLRGTPPRLRRGLRPYLRRRRDSAEDDARAYDAATTPLRPPPAPTTPPRLRQGRRPRI
ncbi:Os01g0547816 [Oryza sativa Japonica Group]|uniref:Os01g0547816 protein n=1 Tax=Oryza sativa subsp. japonica TaxID=39947 RepID=A0A0P0V3V0_ORYSJ|nr:Os01g0547816 [Oryza sativa Japonica Group]